MCADLDSLQQDSAMQLFDDTTFVLRVYADETLTGTRTNEPRRVVVTTTGSIMEYLMGVS